MKLKAYLKKTKIPVTAFAKSLGITRELIYAYFGRSNPSLETAVKIVKVTGGQVSYKDLLVVKRSRK